MATTTDDTAEAQAENIDAPIQVRVQRGFKRALAAPFRGAAALTVKAYEVNETAGLMAYNGAQLLTALLFSYIWPRLGDAALSALIGALYDEGDTISKRKFNAQALLVYGAAFVLALLGALYFDSKFEQHFAEQRQEQVMTDITDTLDQTFGDEEADDE